MVMVKSTAGPLQPFAFGVTVIVALPMDGVKEGIAVTLARGVLGKPIPAPHVTSNTTPAGVPVN